MEMDAAVPSLRELTLRTMGCVQLGGERLALPALTRLQLWHSGSEVDW